MDSPEDMMEAILAEVGRITLSWNELEETLERLIWFYIGTPAKGHIITSLLGNASRKDALNALVAECEARHDIADHLACFAAAFDALRLNRNTVVHAISFDISHGGEDFFFERLKKSVRTREYDTHRRPVKALRTLAGQITNLHEYGEIMLQIMQRRSGLIEQPFFEWPKPPAWPEKFPLPERLN